LLISAFVLAFLARAGHGRRIQGPERATDFATGHRSASMERDASSQVNLESALPNPLLVKELKAMLRSAEILLGQRRTLADQHDHLVPLVFPSFEEDAPRSQSLAEVSKSARRRGPATQGPHTKNLAKLKKMMADPKYEEIQKQVQRIDEEMKAMKADPIFQQLQEQERSIEERMKVMEADPQFQEFQGRARNIEEQTSAMTADPNFREFYEKQRRVDEHMGPLMEYRKKKDAKMKAMMDDLHIDDLTRNVNKQLDAMSADPHYQKQSVEEYVKAMVPPNFPDLTQRMDKQIKTIMIEEKKFQKDHALPKHIDEEMQQIMADPQFREFQQRAKHIDEQMKSMMGNPTFQEFNDRLRRLTEEKQTLDADPQFQDIREKARRLDSEMKAMMADPRFQKFNEQAARVAKEQNPKDVDPE